MMSALQWAETEDVVICCYKVAELKVDRSVSDREPVLQPKFRVRPQSMDVLARP
jgi:hypothetical protein